MASLDAGIPPEDSPTNQNEPPSLFSRPENIDNYKTITDLRLQIEEADIEDYIRGFERGVKDDVLMIGSIGLEDVQVSQVTTWKIRENNNKNYRAGKIKEFEKK